MNGITERPATTLRRFPVTFRRLSKIVQQSHTVIKQENICEHEEKKSMYGFNFCSLFPSIGTSEK